MIRRRIIGGTGRTGDQGIDKSKSPHQVRNRGTGAKNGSQEREPRSGTVTEPRTGAKNGGQDRNLGHTYYMVSGSPWPEEEAGMDA